MKRIALSTVLAILVCTMTACEAPEPPPTAASRFSLVDDAMFGDLTIPIRFENLQVLPETIDRKDLIRNMRVMSRSLGVRCKHCHDMQNEDYAADDLEAKRIARDMLRLVNALNGDLFTWKDAPEATCFMCHYGELKPAMTREAAAERARPNSGTSRHSSLDALQSP